MEIYKMAELGATSGEEKSSLKSSSFESDKIEDKPGSSNGITTTKCTVCNQNFTNAQECLKHELIAHSMQLKRPQKTMRNKLNALLKSLNKDEQQTLHTQLRDTLGKCAAGEELSTIRKFHCMNAENIEMIYARIHNCLKKELQQFGDFDIFAFGSVASGLALRDSDIDLYIATRENNKTTIKKGVYQQRNLYNKINNMLRCSSCFSDVFAIRQARVPIIKCQHTPTGFSLDINLCCPSSVKNTQFLRDLIQFDGRLHDLMVFLKIWCKQLQIIGRGNMTSYCLVTLIIFYLQQPYNGQPILPSIRQLQEHESPNIVLGVNYAYNLTAHMQKLPDDLTVADLIKGFFNFYNQFDFAHYMLAPYLGMAISLQQFKSGEFQYKVYESQLRALTILNGSPAEPLQVERCMCIQDPFCLNHNVAKSISPPNLEYLHKCFQYAVNFCNDTVNITTEAQLYDALLYGIIDEIARSPEAQPKEAPPLVNCHPNSLTYRFTPCRAEMRALAAVHNITNIDNQLLNKLWVRYYTDAITEIITEVYKIDMQTVSPTHRDKHQCLEKKLRKLSKMWLISTAVDMWTGRLHQRISNQTFMENQRTQSAKFQHERRQSSTFAVQLSGTLTLNILSNYTAIELQVQHRGDVQDSNATVGINKKDPLRKFFAMFKCSMQNFNLKEYLQTRVTAATLLNIVDMVATATSDTKPKLKLETVTAAAASKSSEIITITITQPAT